MDPQEFVLYTVASSRKFPVSVIELDTVLKLCQTYPSYSTCYPSNLLWQVKVYSSAYNYTKLLYVYYV